MRPRRISDDQILCAMRDSVLAHGPQVSLDVVAQELGVTAPALLKRFGSRQALMLAALRPDAEPAWVKDLSKGPTDADLLDQLRDIFTQINTFMRVTLPSIIALRESGIPMECVHPKPAVPEVAHKALSRWLKRAAKRRLIACEEIDAAAYAMLGAVQSRVFISHLLKRSPTAAADRSYVNDLAQLFCRALGGAD